MQFSLHAITWNVSKFKYPIEFIRQHFQHYTDFIIIGIQESKYNCKHYKNSIQERFPQYQVVAAQEFTGFNDSYLLSFWLVHQATQDQYNFIKRSGDSIRFDQVLRNKGAMCIKIGSKTDPSVPPLQFVNAHLHAHEGQVNYQMRVNDLKNILTTWSGSVDTILLGDLNFRMQHKTDEFEPQEDGLTEAEQELGLMWTFKEPKINFKPTFKYIPYTSKQSQKRIASWTDRIMFSEFQYELSEPKDISYNTMKINGGEFNANPSDHIPVEFITDLTVKPHTPLLRSKYTVRVPGL